jgi:hypothetical protein
LKDLYNKNYKPLTKESEEDIRDRRISHAQGFTELIMQGCQGSRKRRKE